MQEHLNIAENSCLLMILLVSMTPRYPFFEPDPIRSVFAYRFQADPARKKNGKFKKIILIRLKIIQINKKSSESMTIH